MRFVWIKGEQFSDLIAVCHHAVADGLSAAYLMRDILTFLGDPDAIVTLMPMISSLEALVPPDVEAELLPEVMVNMEEEMAQELPEGMAEVILPPPAPYTVHAHQLTRVQTSLLAKQARAEQTTVHGALGAAFLFAFAQQFGATTSYTRTIQSPVNIRSYLAVPVGESLGTYIHLLTTEVDCSSEQEFWTVARSIRSGFVEQLTSASLFGFAVMVKHMGVVDAATFDGIFNGWLHTRSQHAEYDLSLSNIGRLDFAEHYGRFQLKSLYGPTFSATLDERVVGVCTVNGRLSFTFIHKPELMGTDVVEEIISSALQVLDEVIGGS